MHEPKMAASLTSGLLARKGSARPAMRRQAVLGPRVLGDRPDSLDDLGWNDMGDDTVQADREEAILAAIHGPSPVALHIEKLNRTLAAPTPEPELPAAPAETDIETTVPTTVPAAPSNGRKSAFTLRLDAERHLRLRLLGAVTHRSAQALLIRALDTLLDAHPDVTALAADPKARRAIDHGME